MAKQTKQQQEAQNAQFYGNQDGGYVVGSRGSGYGPVQQAATTKAAAKDTRPAMAAFNSILDTNGNLASKYAVKTPPTVKPGSISAGQLDLKALAADPRALNAMRERAMASGESPWLRMQTDKQRLEEMGLRDQAAQQAMSGAASARGQLAMHGGLGSGASERVAMQSARDMNAARQGIGRQGVEQRLGLGIADDQTKQALLAQTAGLDLNRAGQIQDLSKFNMGAKLDASKFNAAGALDASKFNAAATGHTNLANQSAAISGVGGENQYNLGKYQQDMMGYAADKTGKAIANGGKK